MWSRHGLIDKTMKKNNNRFNVPHDREWNPDVPTETLLRHAVEENKKLHREIGELESEILYLRDVITRKDQAIADFKQWQGNIARMKIEQWASLATKRSVLPPDLIELYNRLHAMLEHKTLFESRVRRLDIAYKKYCEFKEIEQGQTSE